MPDTLSFLDCRAPSLDALLRKGRRAALPGFIARKVIASGAEDDPRPSRDLVGQRDFGGAVAEACPSPEIAFERREPHHGSQAEGGNGAAIPRAPRAGA